MIEPEFVGDGRKYLVYGLLAVFDDVNRSGEPAWVALEAPSGWGKTRVARELYARLAARRQHEPAYWPASILGSQDQSVVDDVSARRKRVYPVVRHVPGSLPAFVWWGIAASVRNGVPSLALAEDVLQLEAHAPYIDDVWRRLTTWGERNEGWWKQPATEVGKETVTELAGQAISQIANVSVPGLGLVLPVVEALREHRADAAARLERLHGDAELGSDSGFDIVDEAYALISRAARPGLPVVVFVEDAHAADGLLAELLDRLICSPAAVLIVTTAWQGHADDNTALQHAMQRVPDRVVTITPETPSLPHPFPAGASLASLDEAARAAIVRSYYPHAEQATLDRLVARYTNPLALELFCGLARYRNRFPDGDLRLPEREIQSLPSTVRDLYRDLWRELPGHVREALTLASLGIPAAIAPDASTDLTWHNQLLMETLADLDLPRRDEITATLEATPTTRAWTRVVSEALRQFHEGDQLRTAHDDDDFLFEEDREQFLLHLAENLTDALDRDDFADPDDRTHAARLAIALHTKGLIPGDAYAGAVAALLTALASEPRELASRITIATQWNEEGRPGGEDVSRLIRWHWADACRDAGRPDHAAELWAELIPDFAQARGWDHPDTLNARHSLGLALAYQGRHQEALECFEELAPEIAAALGAEHPVTMHLRINLTMALEGVGRYQDALEQQRVLLSDRARILGPDHRDTLQTLSHLADSLARLGRHDEALREYELVLGDRLRVLGPDDPDTIASRNNLAISLARAGRVEEALRHQEQFLDDCLRVLGPDHPHTLTGRNNLAAWLADLGRDEEALLQRQAILADRGRVLGPEHPGTLDARNNLALSLGALGRREESMAELSSLLEDSVRILGHNHPDTLRVRNNCAAACQLAGLPERALEHFEVLVDDSARVLGPDHPETLHARRNLLGARAATGDGERAVQEAYELLTDYIRVYGEDHELTTALREVLE